MSGVRVEVAGAEPSGLASMLASLLESNLARDPGRAAVVRRCLVELHALDAGVGVTVQTGAGRVRIADGPARGRPDLAIRASSKGLLDLAGAPLRLGLPDPLTPEGRAVLREIAARRVRVSGMLRHPVRLSRFARLLSAR
jgi:hypothetical protein